MVNSNFIKIKDFYDRAGEYFSQTRGWLWPEMRPYLSRLSSNDRVLDLGCGNARLLNGLGPLINYVGIDFSKTLIKQAKRLNPKGKARFLLGDITKRTIWKNLGKFEAIFCVAVFHHLAEFKQQVYVLRQARDHLKVNGFLYISVWNLFQPKYLKYHFSLASLRLKKKNWRFLYVPFQNKYQRFCVAFDKKYLAKLLRQAGFSQFNLFYSGKGAEPVGAFKGKNLVGVANKLE